MQKNSRLLWDQMILTDEYIVGWGSELTSENSEWLENKRGFKGLSGSLFLGLCKKIDFLVTFL